MEELDLLKPEHAYFYGYILADGNIYEYSRNRGKITLEISEKDKDILYKIQELFPNISNITSRTRNTNFKNNCTFYKLSICNLNFRNKIKDIGLMSGAKSINAFVPSCEFSEIDLVRGLIDGDGSVGITGNGIPFISLVTKSENIKDYYLKFLNKYLGVTKKINRNKRDNVYNIFLSSSKAIDLHNILYYNNCMALDRKRTALSTYNYIENR